MARAVRIIHNVRVPFSMMKQERTSAPKDSQNLSETYPNLMLTAILNIVDVTLDFTLLRFEYYCFSYFKFIISI